MPSRTILAAAFAAVAAIASACGGTDDESVIDVYAASSLTDAFTELEAAFEAANPEFDVRLNLAGSNALQRQILDGADAEVFAPADTALLDAVVPAGAPVSTYATNTLTLVVPVGSGPGEPVTAVADLGRAGVLVARCAPGVPCGDATEQWLTAGGQQLGRTSDESNVRAVLSKVRRGEADAGFVYRTDALAAADEVTEIPLQPTVVTTYGVGAVDPEHAGAEAFVTFIEGPTAAVILDELGFERTP
ncbi:MAG: molybdate ABC transporter substrate-binding protein [Actinomycetota bacterium]